MEIKTIGNFKYENRKTTGYKFMRVMLSDTGITRAFDMYYTESAKNGASREKPEWGYEIYQGSNYIPGSTKGSYSRMYPSGRGLPKKYAEIAAELRRRMMNHVR
jgi:hypothetical protein